MSFITFNGVCVSKKVAGITSIITLIVILTTQAQAIDSRYEKADDAKKHYKALSTEIKTGNERLNKKILKNDLEMKAIVLRLTKMSLTWRRNDIQRRRNSTSKMIELEDLTRTYDENQSMLNKTIEKLETIDQ